MSNLVTTYLKPFGSRIIGFARNHKIGATFIVLIIVIIGYFIYKSIFPTIVQTRYVIGTVQRGTIVTSISGTGQVSVSNQLDIKPKVSGDVIYAADVEGKAVAGGTLLVEIDPTSAQKALRDAQSNLDSAQLSLTKLKQSSADINTILDNAFGDISNAFLDYPTIISAAEAVIASDTINPKAQDNVGFYRDFISTNDAPNYDKMTLFISSASNDYKTARTDYDTAFLAYKNTSRSAGTQAVSDLLESSLSAARSMAQALKSEQNLLDFLTDYATTNSKFVPAILSTYRTNLHTYIGQANTHLANLLSDVNSIKNVPLDIASQELSVAQRQNALQDAQDNLRDYYVRAPFPGVVAKMNVKKGDSASGGTAVATMIGAQQYAQISLNEVDAAKISLQQKATLTFDAIPNLTLTGLVTQIDTLGTVSQGVVTYNIKITLDTQDSRVKEGMSVSAAITTDVKQDVLIVPNGAVKSQGNSSYVEMVGSAQLQGQATSTTGGITLATLPQRQLVEVGLSNDSTTEITSGLSEGDQIIIRTIIGTAAAPAASSAASVFRLPGTTGGGGNRVTGPGR